MAKEKITRDTYGLHTLNSRDLKFELESKVQGIREFMTLPQKPCDEVTQKHLQVIENTV